MTVPIDVPKWLGDQPQIPDGEQASVTLAATAPSSTQVHQDRGEDVRTCYIAGAQRGAVIRTVGRTRTGAAIELRDILICWSSQCQPFFAVALWPITRAAQRRFARHYKPPSRLTDLR